ncbi:hypothetical protein GCM10009677_57530 [Sphaerisporangium rubeum]|uniref:Uncharacterized protein n=1 Tax=Sphaerisporangium rubeum TaxID=321317 RepID=A0A7X0IFR8_9ACTN|nr:hypothetical protein [Sphaerisporangium rubeum]MBB6474331.1 hypothetical protein [Sphaerisporangium rubeum]
MTRKDAQGYAMDLIAYNQLRDNKPKRKPADNPPAPVRLPAKPTVRPRR